METTLKPGMKVTVKHHYGHTDTEKEMKILKVEPGPGYLSGIKVTLDKLPLAVDSGLVIPVPKKKK